ncbi:MAG: hypothetical protein K2Q32_04250 [Alphaproteobacteria bacterium]|nr:hypothetical protein [Alphaproteobacteria bacterium]
MADLKPIPDTVAAAANTWAKNEQAARPAGGPLNAKPVDRDANTGGLIFRQGDTTIRTGVTPSQTGGEGTGFMRVNTVVGGVTFTQKFVRDGANLVPDPATPMQRIKDGAVTQLTGLSAADIAAGQTAITEAFNRAKPTLGPVVHQRVMQSAGADPRKMPAPGSMGA